MKHEKNTWILVANRGAAKLFEGKTEPTLLRSIEHPEGKLKAGQINSDRSGRALPRHGRSSSSLDKAHSPPSHEADRFAHQLAEMLRLEAAHNAYERLVVIAEPRFLGKLLLCLERPLLGRIDRTISRDIAGLDGEHLRLEVTRMLAEAQAA